MSDNTFYVAITFLIVLSVAIVMSAALYGCQKSNRNYYDLADKCIKAGGSFVPTVGQDSAVCITPRAAHEAAP